MLVSVRPTTDNLLRLPVSGASRRAGAAARRPRSSRSVSVLIIRGSCGIQASALVLVQLCTAQGANDELPSRSAPTSSEPISHRYG